MNQQKDRFTPRMFRRLLIPSLASSLGLAFADMADAVVVGQRMGAVGLAAINLSLPLYSVLNLFMHGLGLGGSVRYSQLLGEGKHREAVDCFNRVMQAGLLVSVLIAAIVNLFPRAVLGLLGTTPADGELYEASKSYLCVIALGAPLFFLSYMLNYFLCNDNNQRLASVGFLLGNAADIVLNIVFVLGMGMGTFGAAIATLLGLSATVFCYLPGLFSKNHILRPAVTKPDVRQTFSCFKTGLATSSQHIFKMFFLLIANDVLMRMAGADGVAVFDMVQNASYLILYLYEGTAKAAQPLVSTFYGEKNDVAARHTRSLALQWGVIAGGTATALICLFPGFICGVFGLRGEALTELGALALRLFGLSATFAGVSIILESYYQSVNEERSAFVIAFLRGCAVLLPCTVAFSFLSLRGFWWMYPVTEALSLTLFFLWRRLKKRAGAFDLARVYHSTIRNSNEDISALTGGIEEFCERWEAAPQQQYFVTMAVEEVCMAIITNAFGNMKDGEIQVTLVALENRDFELHIRDNAAFFDPFSLHTGRLGGKEQVDMDAMGMMVIKQQAKEFFYRQYQGFNTLVVRI